MYILYVYIYIYIYIYLYIYAYKYTFIYIYIYNFTNLIDKINAECSERNTPEKHNILLNTPLARYLINVNGVFVSKVGEFIDNVLISNVAIACKLLV